MPSSRNNPSGRGPGLATRIPAGRMVAEMEKAARASGLTGEQADVVDASLSLQARRPGGSSGTGNDASADVLKVIAFAGAGKTTTLAALARARSALPGKAGRGLYLAFNKAIADEARTKFRPLGCQAATMHSLAWSAAGRPADIGTLDGRMVSAHDLVPDAPAGLPDDRAWTRFRLAAAVARTVRAFCASADHSILASHVRQAILDVEPDPDFILDPELRATREQVIDMLTEPLLDRARKLFDLFISGDAPLSHDVYLKFLDLSSGMRSTAFENIGYLMIDEAQDLNPVQRSIVSKTGIPLIAVGDPYQQIYGWRGAENALEQLPDNHLTLYLTQSFRFGETIAAKARAILADRPDGGPEQRLEGLRREPAAVPATGPARAILCRTNIGVIRAGMKALADGQRVHLAVEIDELANDVDSALALKREDRSRIRADAIRNFASWSDLKAEAEAGDRGLATIVSFIEEGDHDQLRELSSRKADDPSRADVTVSTAHKAKGQEWAEVELADDWPTSRQRSRRHAGARSRGKRQADLVMEEWNALYVGATRAMNALMIDPELATTGRTRWPEDDELRDSGLGPDGADPDEATSKSQRRAATPLASRIAQEP